MPPASRHVEMRDIVKCFPGVRANSKVCFDVDTGEVHALLGENGAGKSTLMRQLYGLYQPDEGDIIIDGKRLALRSPADAITGRHRHDPPALHARAHPHRGAERRPGPALLARAAAGPEKGCGPHPRSSPRSTG